MSNNAADAPYYSTVSNYAKNVDGMKMTVCNPGTSIPQSDVGVCDTFEIYESAGLASISTLQSRTFYPNYDKHSFYMLAHTTNSITQTDVTDRIPYVGYMYITNDVEPNPYDTIPPYFLNEVAYLDTGSPTTTPPPSTSPGSPTGLTATTISSSQIDLSWTAPSGTISGYMIERAVGSGAFSTIVSNTATTSTTYSDTGTASATQYTYRVSAINSVGTSTPSNTASATTLTSTLPPTTPPTTISLAVNSVDLAGNSFTGQWVQLNDSSGNTIATGFTPATFSVTSGTQYTVFAANFQNTVFNHWSDGNTNPSRAITPAQSTTLTAYYATSSPTTPPPSPTPTSPGSPTGLAATAISTSQINLIWTAPSGTISGYKIERSTSGGTFSTIVSNTATTATTYSDTGLASATQYTYRVSAINSVGTSSPSNTGSATTLTPIPPSILINPTTGPAGSTIAVSGNSFLSNSAVTVSYDSAAVTTNPGAITTDSSGSFTATFTEPAPSTGSHTVIAKDAASGLASAQFTVTSTTPPTTPPTTISLTVNSVDLSGNSFTGQWVQLNDSSGNTIATGFTPATFSVTSGSQYTVFAANFQNVVFNHWSDGNTNPSRAITPTQSTTLTAYYSTSSTTTPPPSPTSPSSPTGLAATATSTSQINLSWTAPIVDGGSPVTGYEIDRSTDGGISWFTIVSNTATTATTYSDTGLASATQYTYRVSAINSAGTGSPSNTGSVTTLTQTLPSDDTFSLVSVSKAVRSQTCQLTGSKGWICSITTTYVQPPLLGSATVYLEQGGSETSLGSITNSGTINNIPRDVDIKIIVSGGFQPITKLIHTPVSQTNYVYTCTVDGCNFTPDSSSNTATPAPTSPGSPTGLTATTVSSSQIDLSWTAPSGTISGYAIERSTSGGSFSTIVSNTATTSTTYSDTGLASATQYTYRVSAINSAGTGSPSNTGSATTLTQTLPSDDTFSLVSVSKAVRSQTCQLTGSKGWICSITTTYVQPPLLGSATVYLEQGGSETSLGSITNSGTINNIPRDVDIKIIVSGGFQPITKLIHTPVSQTNYAYTCTVDGCNFTPDSSSNTATPAPTSPGSPTGLTATTVSSSQIDLSWTAPSGTISGYAIERSTSGGSFSTIVSNTATTATTYSDTGLASATQYTYRVSAINSAGTGSPSNTGSATTLTQTLPSDDTFSLVSVSKAVRSQTCQLTGSKGWICSITTTYVQPPLLGSATVYLEQGGSETSLGSITNSGTINNIPRDVDIKIIVSGGFQPITKLIHTPVSQTNYVYTCTVDGCNFTP